MEAGSDTVRNNGADNAGVIHAATDSRYNRLLVVRLRSTIGRERFQFASVREVLAKANPPKSGDCLAGVAARSPIERVAARAVLSELTLEELRTNPAVPYDEDEITRVIDDSLDAEAYRAVK